MQIIYSLLYFLFAKIMQSSSFQLWLFFEFRYFNEDYLFCNYSAPIWRTDSYKCYTCVTSLKTQRNYRLILEKFYSYTI